MKLKVIQILKSQKYQNNSPENHRRRRSGTLKTNIGFTPIQWSPLNMTTVNMTTVIALLVNMTTSESPDFKFTTQKTPANVIIRFK